MQELHLCNNSIKLLFVGRMGKTSIDPRSIEIVNSKANSAAVVEGIEDTAISKVVGETTLLEHLTRECGKDKIESFVEEHNYRPLGC